MLKWLITSRSFINMLFNVKYSILYFSVYQNMQNYTVTLEESLMVSYKTKPYKYDHIYIYISSEELTHWKRLWCWEGLGARGKGDDRGWDGWMASLTRWTRVSVNSGSWWWTGKPGVLWFMGSQMSRTWLSDWSDLISPAIYILLHPVLLQ